VPITDATGAGDSFRAGMIYGLHQGWHLPECLRCWHLPECLRWATAVGALQVQRSLIQAPPPGLDQVASLARQIDVHAQ